MYNRYTLIFLLVIVLLFHSSSGLKKHEKSNLTKDKIQNQQKSPLILLQKSFKYQDSESKFQKSVEQNNNVDEYSQIKKQFHHQKENTNKIIEECLEYKTGICRENFYQEVYNNDKNEENQRKILEIYNEQEKEFQQFAETLDENTTLDDVDNFFNSNLMGNTDTKSFWQCFLQSVHKCFELQ